MCKIIHLDTVLPANDRKPADDGAAYSNKTPNAQAADLKRLNCEMLRMLYMFKQTRRDMFRMDYLIDRLFDELLGQGGCASE